MHRIRYGLIILGTLLCLAAPAAAEVEIRFGVPHLDLRLRLPVFPELVLVPGLPVYYAPRLETNYFFYDGLYWIYVDDHWYASEWYDGPWWLVEPDYLPLFILRIPVRYYRFPPPYFHPWPPHEPPRWGHRWGHDWERRHRDWDRRRFQPPPPAPLPIYQRHYQGERYPRDDDRRQLRDRHYRYQPRDSSVREQLQRRQERRDDKPDRRQPQAEPPRRGPGELGAPPPQRPRPDQRGPQRYERRLPQDDERERPPKLKGQGRNERRSEPEERRGRPEKEGDRERRRD